MDKTCIVIVGPTASGKTALAINVAQHFQTEIISADSRQCFKELNIGVAKPTEEQLAQVNHYFINSHSISENLSAADFEDYALNAVDEIFKKSNVAVMCGGTGLYIKAFAEGLDPIAPTNEKIKSEIAEAYEEYGFEWLQKEIQMADPLFWEKGEIKNPHRMLRALEVFKTTGISIIAQQKKIKKQRPFKIIKVGVKIDRDLLYENINRRVDLMQQAGLEQEAIEIKAFKHLNALQTVGYTELFDYFDGKITRERAFDLIKQNSRHYAKRQLTWFKKDDEIVWLRLEEMVSYLANKCGE